LIAVKSDKPLSGADNCLEYLLVGISKAFKLNPKQAATLLTENGKYLAQILIKGLRSDYQVVINWLKMIYDEIDHFAELVKKEDNVSAIAFKTFEGGFYSKNEEVCLWTLNVLSKLSTSFTFEELTFNIWPWLISKDGGLESILYSYKKHKQLREIAVQLLVNLGKGRLSELFNTNIREIMSKENEFMVFLTEIIHHMTTMSLSESMKKEINFLSENWLIIAQEKVKKQNIETKTTAMRLVRELCICFTDLLEELKVKALDILIQSTKDKSYALKYYSLALLFEFLESSAQKKQTFSSTIYKALIELFIKFYADTSIRSFIQSNFSYLYSEFTSMPLSILLRSLSNINEMNVNDFGFVFKLLDHEKFELKSALPLMNSIAQAMSEDPVFTGLASSILFITFDKYESKECKKGALKILFNAILANLKISSKNKAITQDRHYNKREDTYKITDLMLKIQIDILLKFYKIYLDDTEIKDLMLNHTLVVHYRMRSIIRLANNPLRQVLEKFGNPDELLDKFVAYQEQLVVTKKGKTKLLAIEEASVVSPRDSQIVPYKKPRDFRQETLVTLEKIRYSLSEKEMNHKILTERKIKMEERRKKILKEQIELKNIELGYTSRKDKESIILSEGKLEKILPRYSQIVLLDLNDEEDRDREAINFYKKKHNLFFRHLFNKYANTCLFPKKVMFDALKQKSELISVGEFRKMLSDHNIDSNSVKQEDLITLYRLLNIKEGRSDLMNLTYESFVALFIQIAIHIYSKPSFSTLPLVESVKKLKKKFIDTELAYIGLSPSEQAFISELEKKSKANPSFIIPEGYRKVVEQKVTYSYELLWSQNEAIKICSELLDSILNKAIGIHFIEPLVKYVSVERIRPKKNTSIVEKRLPASIKFAVAKLPLDLRDIGLEVGMLMDQVIKAVEENRNEISDSKKLNKVAAKKIEMMEEDKKIKEARERKRQQRHAELKLKLKEDEKAKKENEEKKKIEEQKRIQEEKKKEKQIREAKKKEYAEREERQKKRLMEVKKEELELELKKEELELELKKRKAKELRFKSKQKRDEIDKMLKKKEEEFKKKQQKDKEDKLLEDKKQKQRKSQIINDKLSRDREQHQQAKAQQEALAEFMKDPSVVELLNEYKPHLDCIFEYYAKLDNVGLELASKLLWKVRTFAKFCKQLQITPHLLSSDLANTLSKGLVREKPIIDDIGGLMIDYEGFLKALVIISSTAEAKLKKSLAKPAKVLNSSQLSTSTLKELFTYMKLNPKENEKVLPSRLVNFQPSYSGKPVTRAERKPSLSKSPERSVKDEMIAPNGKKETWSIKV